MTSTSARTDWNTLLKKQLLPKLYRPGGKSGGDLFTRACVLVASSSLLRAMSAHYRPASHRRRARRSGGFGQARRNGSSSVRIQSVGNQTKCTSLAESRGATEAGAVQTWWLAAGNMLIILTSQLREAWCCGELRRPAILVTRVRPNETSGTISARNAERTKGEYVAQRLLSSDE